MENIRFFRSNNLIIQALIQEVTVRRPILLLLFILLAMLPACSRSYPGLPDLPEKDWLNPDKKEKPASANLDIYSPDKTLSMDDLVWLAIQQSPAISSGRVNLDIQEINKRDAKWRYIPELHVLYTISNNITRYNENDPTIKNMEDSGYGETKYQLSFSGYFNNPVATYFSVKAADELLQVAIVTQRKAIAQVINQIAVSLLAIDLYEQTIASLKKSLEMAKKRAEIVAVREKHETRLYNPGSVHEDNIRELELRIREDEINLMAERFNLKRIVGLDSKQALKVDAKSVYGLLDKFNMDALNWQDVWKRTEDNYLLRQQVRLEQANVMLAWAQYMPNISFVINESAPNGQAQPANAETDQFLHITFDFPILDWGHRWRMAETAEARQRQRRLDEIQREREYGDRWEKMRQDLLLAQTRLERARISADNAAKRLQAVEIAATAGSGATYVEVADLAQQETEKELAMLHTARGCALARLAWIHEASGLSNHYLGKAGYEETDK